MFNESDIVYTSKDIRFTVKGNNLYAIVLAWPEEQVVIKSLVQGTRHAGYYLYPDEIASVTMLGDGNELEWELVKVEGLKITPPEEKPCEHAYVFKIERYHHPKFNQNIVIGVMEEANVPQCLTLQDTIAMQNSMVG